MSYDLKKYAPKRADKLIHINKINEELYLLEESKSDFITKSGNIYKYYYDDLYFKKKTYINKSCGYIYVNITCKDGINRNRRLHVLLAKTFLPNPDPNIYKIVGHKDNNKTNNKLSNLSTANILISIV